MQQQIKMWKKLWQRSTAQAESHGCEEGEQKEKAPEPESVKPDNTSPKKLPRYPAA